MPNPLVSITIPSYNHARFLPEAIESVLAQTYDNIELIIVDDGSTDESLRIATDYATRLPEKIRVHTHQDGRNHGISKTSNLLLRLIRGKYWNGLASDDILLPHKIRQQVDFLESNPDCALVYSPAKKIDENGHIIEGLLGYDIHQQSDPLLALLQDNPIYAITTLVRCDALQLIGPQDESLVFQDWDLWLRFASSYKIGFIDEPSILYRIHSFNSSIGKPLRDIHNGRAVRLKWLDAPRDHALSAPKYKRSIQEAVRNLDRWESEVLIDRAINKARKGQRRLARAAFYKALRISSLPFLRPRRLAAVLKHLLY